MSKIGEKGSPGDLQLLSEKIRGIRSASELISDKTCGESGIWSGGLAAQMCYQEQAIVLQVLERCFVDGYEGERLLKIIKEIILRADQILLQARKQSLNLFNISNEEVKKDVDHFFSDFLKSTSILF